MAGESVSVEEFNRLVRQREIAAALEASARAWAAWAALSVEGLDKAAERAAWRAAIAAEDGVWEAMVAA